MEYYNRRGKKRKETTFSKVAKESEEKNRRRERVRERERQIAPWNIDSGFFPPFSPFARWLILFLPEYTCLRNRIRTGVTALRVDTLPDDVTSRAGVIYPFAGSDRGRESEHESEREWSKPAVGGRVFQPPISDAIPSLPAWRRRRLERPFRTISLPRKRLLDPTLLLLYPRGRSRSNNLL